MRNDSQDPGYRGGSNDGTDARRGVGPESLNQNSDVPGYKWQDSGAAMTTGRDFDRQSWPERPQARDERGSGGSSNQTSEPGPNVRSDARQQPEQTSGLDRPPDYLAKEPEPPERLGIERATADTPAADRGMPPQPFGDHRYGQPDEWSSQQREWPNRPRQFEEVTSGFGTGMGAGMYWSGESAREDDEMEGRTPDGRQIPARGSLAPRGPYAGRGPRGYQRSDERIAEDVSDRLTDDEYLDASDISVTIQDGVVVLEGAVESADARRRAEEIADSCSGVTGVQNRLEVSGRDAGVTEQMSNPTG